MQSDIGVLPRLAPVPGYNRSPTRALASINRPFAASRNSWLNRLNMPKTEIVNLVLPFAVLYRNGQRRDVGLILAKVQGVTLPKDRRQVFL